MADLSEDGISKADIDTLSESENPYGIDISWARPIGGILSILTGMLFIGMFVSFGSEPAIYKVFIILIAFLLLGTSIKFTMTEKESGRFKNFALESGMDLQDSDTGPTKSVCRECREKISPEVKRCPHCGWKPKKRGGLWWGTTAVMAFNPIGWALGAKGASDNLKAKKGVSEDVAISPEAESSTTAEEMEMTPTERLERINELKEDGIITEEEFEAKKEELLGQI
jgi:hypothetical protein